MMTSQQVVKFWEYQIMDFNYGFLIQKLAAMPIFKFLTRVHRQKSIFDLHLSLLCPHMECDVTTGGQVLWKLQNWLHVRVSHLKMNRVASFWGSNTFRSPEIDFWPSFIPFMYKYGNVTSQQVVKFCEYCETDFIFEFPTSKWTEFQVFEVLTQIDRQKSIFDLHLSLLCPNMVMWRHSRWSNFVIIAKLTSFSSFPSQNEPICKFLRF